MSDYRFGDDYKLSIYPKDAMNGWGEIDMNKVETVEIEWVDFIRKPDDKSRWYELFGTPERAARTLRKNGKSIPACYRCLVRDECANLPEDSECPMDDYDALFEWLRGDAE